MRKAGEADWISYSIPHLCFPLPYMQIWDNPFISWNPEECVSISKLTVSAKNLWLPDIFIMESCVSELGKAQSAKNSLESVQGTGTPKDSDRGKVSIN